MATRFLYLALLVTACCGEGDSSLDQDIDRTTDLANQKARSACGAPDDVTTSDPEGDTEAGRCYNELSFDVEPCERDALRKDPDTSRNALACTLAELNLEIATCCEGGNCTYFELEACDSDRFADPACEALWTSLEEHLSEDC